jgi:membrane-bound lytic murein transglycosylase C
MPTASRAVLYLTLLALVGCSAGDALRAARIAATGDVAGAGRMAAEKTVRYAMNPTSLARDLKTLRDAVKKVWGGGEEREPKPKQYVKYVQNYQSRATVDFDTGLVTVETVDRSDPAGSLRRAVVATVLTPLDPRAVDLFSAKEVELSGTPFLLGEVKDFEGRDLDTPERAEAFAARLVAEGVNQRQAGEQSVHFVRFALVPDHLPVRARKVEPYVTREAQRFGVSKSLIFAVIRTESDFNPYAVSSAPAFGLMQIVPDKAGAEVHAFLTKEKGAPTRDMLFDPEANIAYGAAYLHLLDTRHLAGVADPVARQYCQIAAYNTGPGNVLRSFDPDRDQAPGRINAMRPDQVYAFLRAKLPYAETRSYLEKVTRAQKDFVAF